MPDSTEIETDAAQERSGRGVKLLVWVLAFVFLPAGIYALHVVGQLEQIRDHNLRSLADAAQVVAGLLENARTTVISLGEDPQYACTFFERQTRLSLLEPPCERVPKISKERSLDKATVELRVSSGVVEITGKVLSQRTESIEAASDQNPPQIRIKVLLGTLLEQVPSAFAFEQLFIVDENAVLLGAAVSPRQSSPLRPPRETFRIASSPVRVLSLAGLRFRDSTKENPIDFRSLGDSTLVQAVELAGKHFTLMCQPWRVALDAAHTNVKTWRLCGLVDSQRSFRQALEVAPQIVVLLLILLTLSVVSWPILKVLSLAPRERIRFSDMYLTLISTLTLTMLLTVGVADIGTYRALRTSSQNRLRALASEIDANLRAEIHDMREQLQDYDKRIGLAHAELSSVMDGQFDRNNAIRISCLRLPPAGRSQSNCSQQNPRNLVLPVPAKYEFFEAAYWLRPQDGWQAIKATVQERNTPAIKLSSRNYFQNVRRDHLWSMTEPVVDEFFVETSASKTTGEFFAALSMPSTLLSPESPPLPFVAVLSGRPVSFRYPVLAPGVGFAIADESGRVIFHSDEKRAALEDLFSEDTLTDRLRAAFAADSDAEFHANYQTRPHQVHVHPMHDLPWAIVTFADDEVLRVAHIELLARTAILLTLYLLLAFLGTLLYMLFHGRDPPTWVWPRRERRYRKIYTVAIWSLAAQLLVFLLALDFMRGEYLVLTSLLLPLPALLTILAADRAARELARLPASNIAAARRESRITLRQKQWSRFSVFLTAILAAASALAMTQLDTASAALPWSGVGTYLLCALLIVLVVVVPTLSARARTVLTGLRTRTLNAAWIRWWWEPLTPHIAATLMVWVLLGALPAYALYKYALSSQMTIVTKQEQDYLARAFAWRRCGVEEESKLIRLPPDQSEILTQQRLDLPKANRPYSDVYKSARLSDRGGTLSDFVIETEPAYGAEFWRYVANIAPIYNETTTYSRYLDPYVGDGRWSWHIPAKDRIGHPSPQLAYRPTLSTGCYRSMPPILGRWPLREPYFGWWGWITGLAFMILMIAWVSYGARRLFFGEVEENAYRTNCGDPDRPLDAHLGRLGQAPDLDWARAEVAAIFDTATFFSDGSLEDWCSNCTTRRGVVDRILERSQRFYDRLWSECGSEEKLLLIQLVEEGYANPRQSEIVRLLLRRGLLKRDPVLRPMNHSFALFVEAHSEPDLIRTKEKAYQGLRWSRVRGLLIAALVLTLVFLSFTQRDVVDVWIAYLTTAAAGAAGVLRLLSFMSKPSAQKPS